jgi:modulator of FtsH protease HflK
MKNQRRGKNVALVGAVLQALVTVVAVVIWQLTGSRAALISLWFLLGGLPLWLLTMLLFYARQLAAQEDIELETLNTGDGETIFSDGGQMQMCPARSRVIFLEKWIVPLFTLLFAAYQAGLAIVMLRYLQKIDTTPETFAVVARAPGAVFLIIAGFAAFLFSRYATGMSSNREWSLLRANGSYTLVASIFLWACALAIGLASAGNELIDIIVAYVLLGIQLIFAVELLMYFVLDIYRPRIYGEEYRTSYDSRVFALLAEPSRVGHSIADTINYQFGFEVSSTWFYKLVSRAFVPLIIFGVIVIFLLSSIVIVNEGEVYIVKTFGKLQGGENSTLKSGIHLKWPWPVSSAERFDTGVTHEIVLGVGQGKAPMRTKEGRELVIWSEEHGFSSRQEKDFLIAVPPRAKSDQELASQDEGKAPTPSVNIIKLVVVIRYRVTDPYKYGYKYTNSKSVMENVAREAMVQYCASATLDRRVGDDSKRPQGLMSFGRIAASRELKKRISERLGSGNLDIGVNVEYLGIASAHPPSSAVPDYEKVLESERLQDKQRFEAEAKASKILADVSGDPAQALQLYLALHREEVFEDLKNRKDVPEVFKSYADDVEKEAKGQITNLKKEISREKLLGKKQQDVIDRRNLIKSYESFLVKLNDAEKDRLGFNYASEIAASQEAVNSLFGSLAGSPARIIATAEASRWEKELKARTELTTYQRKLLPYYACKEVYMFDQYMNILDETLPDKLKYVLGVDRKKVQIRLNLETQGEGLQGVLDAAE